MARNSQKIQNSQKQPEIAKKIPGDYDGDFDADIDDADIDDAG